MIQVTDLTFSYKETAVLNRVNFRVNNGEFVGIIGPNGAGKSTLLKLLDGILKNPGSGIRIDGREITAYSRRELARKMGFVPQQFRTAFQFTAREIVMMGRFPHQGLWSVESQRDISVVEQAMQETDCAALADRLFASLSGGEQQRVVLASALAQEANILLLDEPTTALDLKHQVHFYRILKRLQQQQHKTILTVTHDINLAIQFCDRVIVLKDGELVADGRVTNIIDAALIEEVFGLPVYLISHPESGLPVILPVIQ